MIHLLTYFNRSEGVSVKTVETDESVNFDNNEPDLGPPTDNPSKDRVYNESTEMSSFLPVVQK